MSYLVSRRLTETELAHVLEAVERAPTPAQALVDALRCTVDCLLADVGDSWDAHGPERPIQGTSLAIPESQWTVICEALMQRAQRGDGDAVTDAVNVGLDWMNRGPASYAESAGQTV